MHDYNTERPHSSLGYATPVAFAAELEQQRAGSNPPVASPALMRDNTGRNLAAVETGAGVSSLLTLGRITRIRGGDTAPGLLAPSRPQAPFSEGKIGRGDRIRTCDPLLPKQMRYQAAPLPDNIGWSRAHSG
jgi:hypothetical protein